MRSLSVLLLSLTCVSAGCGGGASAGAGGTPGTTVQDPATNYAQAIRSSALSVRSALREQDGNLDGVKGNTESLLEALEGYEAKADAAPHKAIYDEIVRLAKELKELFDASAQPGQIQQKINELATAAEKLPGASEAPAAANVNT